MEEPIINSGQFIFRPKARLIKTIGEELISNDNVAIAELVKNSYDAGSPIVEITFDGSVKRKNNNTDEDYYLAKEGASITIFDQGEGMDFDVVRTAWMEPATNYKKKAENNHSKRKFSGEKGIGRFASAKLSSRLELVTKQKNKDEVFVKFDWNAFNDEENYLEDVKVDWIIRPAQDIKESGTILRLIDLTEDWDKAKISDLRVALSRLLNPIAPVEDFLISINLPKQFDQSIKGIIDRPETLNRPNYYIKGSIDKNGCPQEIAFYSKNLNKEEPLDLPNNIFNKNREYTAGPFTFVFKIWNRDDENLNILAAEANSLVKYVKKDLDDLCGISIYRDNIRVLPYGNHNNDWVRLDMRRVNNPTLRLSNNQIVGYISIGLESNPLLKDQSNREGIVESTAFEDLKEYIKILLNEVEQRRYSERPRENHVQGPTRTNLLDKLSLASISSEIRDNKPNHQTILNLINQKEAEIKDVVNLIQQDISRYRRLSTLGQLVDPIIHDGNNYLNKIDLKATLILEKTQEENYNINFIANKVKEIQNVRSHFSDLFKRLEPFSGRKRGRPQSINIEQTIDNLFSLNTEELKKYSIDYVISQTKHIVTIDESELAVVLMNLIQNSIYWLSTVSNERVIHVDVKEEDNALSIIVSDNGPGIKPGCEDLIFTPYYSTKPDGIGLGLAIAGEIMAEYEGTLSLIPSKLGGASFKLLFRKRI